MTSLGFGASVVAVAGSLSGDRFPPKSRACTLKLYGVTGSSSGMIADVLVLPWMIEVPFRNTEYQRWGPFSIDDQASETWVGPTSVTETSGFEGGIVSRGSVTVTALLAFEEFPAASTAHTRNVKVRPASSPAVKVKLVTDWLTVALFE
jgi:hypothetical protein